MSSWITISEDGFHHLFDSMPWRIKVRKKELLYCSSKAYLLRQSGSVYYNKKYKHDSFYLAWKKWLGQTLWYLGAVENSLQQRDRLCNKVKHWYDVTVKKTKTNDNKKNGTLCPANYEPINWMSHFLHRALVLLSSVPSLGKISWFRDVRCLS